MNSGNPNTGQLLTGPGPFLRKLLKPEKRRAREPGIGGVALPPSPSPVSNSIPITIKDRPNRFRLQVNSTSLSLSTLPPPPLGQPGRAGAVLTFMPRPGLFQEAGQTVRDGSISWKPQNGLIYSMRFGHQLFLGVVYNLCGPLFGHLIICLLYVLFML